MRKGLRFLAALVVGAAFVQARSFAGEEVRLSEDTEACVTCHVSVSPGIVADWRRSLHSRVAPSQALKKEESERRFSAERLPERLSGVAVGCAECHNLNPEKHKDTFEHAEYRVHVVVTPNDCATCHPAEVKQYGQNLMSHAYGNLRNNPVFHSLVHSVNGIQSFEETRVRLAAPDAETDSDSCFYCQGGAFGQRNNVREMAEWLEDALKGRKEEKGR